MKQIRRIAVAASVAAFAASQANAAGPYAIFKTSQGEFVCELFPDKAPKTVENFIALAKGTKEWQHPATKEVMKNKPLYDGTVFHRTIPNFMIQGGDPLGKGIGGPGYKFADEFSDLGFDAPGILAMANSGPNSNGSQFFVTVAATPWLNQKHSIFGKVVSGMDVVNKIVEMPSQPGSGVAINPVKIESLTISDTLPGAKKADAPAAKADPSTSKTN